MANKITDRKYEVIQLRIVAPRGSYFRKIYIIHTINFVLVMIKGRKKDTHSQMLRQINGAENFHFYVLNKDHEGLVLHFRFSKKIINHSNWICMRGNVSRKVSTSIGNGISKSLFGKSCKYSHRAIEQSRLRCFSNCLIFFERVRHSGLPQFARCRVATREEHIFRKHRGQSIYSFVTIFRIVKNKEITKLFYSRRKSLWQLASIFCSCL